MRVEHFDGNDVVVVDVRDPRRTLSFVSEVIFEPGEAVVMLSASARLQAHDLMSILGFGSPEETPTYSIRSRTTSQEYWCGPVRLAWS